MKTLVTFSHDKAKCGKYYYSGSRYQDKLNHINYLIRDAKSRISSITYYIENMGKSGIGRHSTIYSQIKRGRGKILLSDASNDCTKAIMSKQKLLADGRRPDDIYVWCSLVKYRPLSLTKTWYCRHTNF